MNVDDWEPEKWQKELDTHDILVMTAQVFLDRLESGFFPLSIANLLVLDECHHSSKGDPYRRIMDIYADHWKVDASMVPKVLGLTAALVKQKVSNKMRIERCLQDLQRNLHASIETAMHPDAVLPYSACPKPEIVLYGPHPAIPETQSFQLQLDNLQRKYQCSYNVEMPDVFRRCSEILRQIAAVMKSLGTWSARHVCGQFAEFFQQMNAGHSIVQWQMFIIELSQLSSGNSTVPSHDQLLSYCPDNRVSLILQLLENWPTQDKLSAIIFVEQRVEAFALKDLLLFAMQSAHPSLRGWIHPAAIIGFNSYRGSASPWSKPQAEDYSLAKLQDKALKDFEDGSINLLVATNVLEEGVDIGICNLVIRFDLPKNYCSYIQSRGRARHPKSRFIILQSTEEKNSPISAFAETSMEIQSIVQNEDYCNELESDMCDYDHLIPPYKIESSNGNIAVLKLSNAVSRLYRYCSSLPSDLDALKPQFTLSLTMEDQFQATLRLPKNSPLHHVSCIGRPMSTKTLAKRAAAFNMCIILHDEGELDDHLLGRKITETVNDFLLPHDINAVGVGTKRRKQVYEKHIPFFTTSFLQTAEQSDQMSCYVTRVLISHGTSQSCQAIGVLSQNRFPSIPEFTLFQSGASVSVKFESANSTKISISRNKGRLILEQYHARVIQCVFTRKRCSIEFHRDLYTYLFIPLIEERCGSGSANPKIDWELASNVADMLSIEKRQPQLNMIEHLRRMDPSVLAETVFVPWYKTKNWKLYSILSIDSRKTAQSAFPDQNYPTYERYFNEKYGVELRNRNQPLLESKEIYPSGLNLLLPNQTRESRLDATRCTVASEKPWGHHFLPELVLQHEIPLSLWRYLWLVPSISYRLNRILCALEICKKEFSMFDAQERWEPLSAFKAHNVEEKFNNVSCRKREPEEHSLSNSSDNKESWIRATLGALLGLPSESLECDFEGIRAGYNETNASAPHDNIPPPYNVEEKGLRCMPALVCEALTTKSAGDNFDLEHLETLGDAYLKLKVTEFLFRNYPQWHEGHLTAVRTSLVCNKALYGIGSRYGLPHFMSCHQFQPGVNWMPPGFVLQSLDTADDGPTSHEVSDKSIADCTEAVIGAFVITAGEATAGEFIRSLRILDNIQIKPNPKAQFQCDGADMSLLNSIWNQKNFDGFENLIQHKFKNRTLLIAAFTHPSYIGGPTESYQRLEFIGDAILDYVVIRYCFGKCHNLSPGFLTDVRAALANNRFFGKIAGQYGFQKFLLSSSYQVHRAIDRFVKREEAHAFSFETNENEPPKILGDLIESVAGAIYLDSQRSLDCVWNSFYPLIGEFIEKYVLDPPINAVRKLHELAAKEGWDFSFEEKENNEPGKVCMQLTIEECLGAEGEGRNKRDAKLDAARKFLQLLQCE